MCFRDIFSQYAHISIFIIIIIIIIILLLLLLLLLLMIIIIIIWTIFLNTFISYF